MWFNLSIQIQAIFLYREVMQLEPVEYRHLQDGEVSTEVIMVLVQTVTVHNNLNFPNLTSFHYSIFEVFTSEYWNVRLRPTGRT